MNALFKTAKPYIIIVLVLLGILAGIRLFDNFQSGRFKDRIVELEQQNKITTESLIASNSRLREFEKGFGKITSEITDVTDRVSTIASGIGTGIEGLEQGLRILEEIAGGFERVELIVFNTTIATTEK